tara:strand:+ start:279 stop:632 length:354 start_codon:yes stop_codon:yes gene_type:complete
MNLFKATIAAAAVTVCCLGNEMPAKANEMFDAGYSYGFLYGVTSMTCLNYEFGYISRSTMLMQMRATESQDETSPAIKAQIVKNFEKAAREGQDQGKCLHAVRQVFGNRYQTTDNWD